MTARLLQSLGRLRHSIGWTQTVAVIVASSVIGLALSAAQLVHTFRVERDAAAELKEEILSLAQGGATTASWTLDARLAREVIQSVIALGDVREAVLHDERGEVLARARREPRRHGAATRWFAQQFIGDSVRGTRTLSVEVGDNAQQVGVLSIVLAPEAIAARFVDIAASVLIAGIVQALAIGLVLLWLTSWLVTRPLRRAATAVRNIDPENPQVAPIPIAPSHRDNELGQLLTHSNTLFARLSNVQAQLRDLATHDPLTELPNRVSITDRLERALARAQRAGTRVAVLFLDLDDFKTFNDSRGHSHGDALLAQVAQRLLGALRSNDAVGRLGGDEFLIVIEDLEEVDEVVATVQRVETALAEPLAVESGFAEIQCSIGIAIYPDDGDNASDLMRHSDMAMYQAKDDSATRFHFFAREMSERMQQRVEIESALRRALANDEFHLAYQPKIDARTGALCGCEALLRWHRDGRVVPAGEFIHVAEHTGIVVDIGQRVLELAGRQARLWAGRRPAVPIAVNVSAQQLRDPNFVDGMLKLVDRHGVAPAALDIEITETVLIERFGRAVEVLGQLRDAGFGISIDDFGTGYSSLAYLTHLPASVLKIDRSFVSGAQRSDVVLRAVVAMARALGMTTVAEGVETDAQRASLVAMGCDVLQGYLLGKPMPAAEFEERFMVCIA